jgi:radical SAM protein with 4Fe4S-binding SPASM domain
VYYKLNENIALRSWKLVPYAYYYYGDRNAKGLKLDEWELLKKCDGITEIEDSQLLEDLQKKGLCKPCEFGDKLTDWQKVRSFDNRYFPALTWAITGKCNLSCKHCFMAADNAPLMTEFSWEQCLSLLDDLESTGVQSMGLSGGEPLIHPNFMDIVREASKRRIDIDEVLTNGVFITEEMLDEFISLDCHPLFLVSFDGLTHHDWMRGVKGTEEKTIAAVKLLHKKGFRVRIQMNLHKGNMDTALDTIKFFDQMGIEELRLIRTTEAPRWQENGNGLCLDLEDYYNIGLEIAKEYIATNPQMSLDIWLFLLLQPERKSYHLRPVEGGEHRYRDTYTVCAGNRGMFAILSDGEIVPCIQMSGRLQQDKISMGNIHTTPLGQLLSEGVYLESVTATVGELKEINPTCQACEYWKLCMGGCRACAYALTDNIMGYDPTKCIYFKKGYMQKTLEMFKQIENETGVEYYCMDDIVK